MLREYKINFLIFNSQRVESFGTVKVDMTECITIPVEQDNSQYNKEKAIKEKKKKEQFCRAKVKRETMEKIEEYWYER